MGNNEERVEIIGFHGTDVISCKKILGNGCSFKESKKETEWAGTGIYFFISEKDKKAYNDAHKWATDIKKIPNKNVSVIKANIRINKNKILDLREELTFEIFHEYKDSMFQKAIEVAREKKQKLKKDSINGRRLDTKAINRFCEEMRMHAVIVQRYINFKKNSKDNIEHLYDDYASSIPNCTIFCLRNQSFIIKKECIKNE